MEMILACRAAAILLGCAAMPAIGLAQSVSLTSDPPEMNRLDQQCERMEVVGKRRVLPPYCSHFAHSGTIRDVQTARAAGGPSRSCIQLDPPFSRAQTYLYKLGDGWTATGVVPFRLTSPECSNMWAFAWLSGPFESNARGGWVPLGKLNHNQDYWLIHSRKLSDKSVGIWDENIRAWYREPPVFLPSPLSTESIHVELWLCTESSPLGGCAPANRPPSQSKSAKRRVPANVDFSASPPGQGIGELQAVLDFSGEPPAAKAYANKSCSFFCSPQTGSQSSDGPRTHGIGQNVCHQGEMYTCVETSSGYGVWRYRSLCSDAIFLRSIDIPSTLSSVLEKNCSQNVKPSDKENADDSLAMELDKTFSNLASAMMRKDDRGASPGKSGGNQVVKPATTSPSVDRDACIKVWEATDNEMRQFNVYQPINAKGCWQPRAIPFMRDIASRVVAACANYSTYSRDVQNNVKIAEASYQDYQRKGWCP